MTLVVTADGREVNIVHGDRVELHPACDWWMRGARYAEVIENRLGDPDGLIRVRLDAVPHTILIGAADIQRKV